MLSTWLRPTRRWLRRLLVVVGVALVTAFVFWFFVIPNPRRLDERNPDRTALMEQRIDEARNRGEELEIRHEWVALDRISGNLERAVVVAEDYRFRQHEGVDWISLAEEVRWSGDDDFSWTSPPDLGALLRAFRYVWANRSEIRGRSTITQQLAKNLYFGTDRSMVRKALEAVVARRLERRLEKDRILELYLNLVEWGPGVFGAEAAARTYFGRSAATLTLDQAAALAATLPHPLTSNPAHRPSRMLWRKNLILDRIDPTRGVPVPLTPLPPPDLDFAIPDLEPLPTIETGIVGADSTTAPDSTAVDTASVRPDTMVVDTTGVEATRVDTTVVDTGRSSAEPT